MVALLATAACSDDDDSSGEEGSGDGESSEGGLLAEVRDRGTLNCGVNDAVPGFGVVDDEDILRVVVAEDAS